MDGELQDGSAMDLDQDDNSFFDASQNTPNDEVVDANLLHVPNGDAPLEDLDVANNVNTVADNLPAPDDSDVQSQATSQDDEDSQDSSNFQTMRGKFKTKFVGE